MVAHHSKVRNFCREGVIGNCAAGVGESIEKTGFSGVRKADKTDIGDDQEFNPDSERHALLSRLGISGSLVGGRTEVPVAPPAPSASEKDVSLMVRQIHEHFTAFGILENRSRRNGNDDIHAVSSVFTGG